MPYLGQRPSKGDENNFKILDDISSYTLTFDGSDSSVISAANDTITSLSHRFVQGQRVTYNKGGGTVIPGLSDGVYYIIKEDHNTIKLATSASNATNGIAVNITGTGGGSSHTLNVAFDGVNTKFKATHTNGQKTRITRSAQLVISINGVIQQPHDTATPSTGFGFDLDGTIVFSQAPVVGDIYWAHVLTNNNVTFDISDNDVDNFTGNGSTVSFNLSKTPPDNRNVLVTIDGVVQYPNDPDGTVRAYTVVENVLTFTTAPASATEIQVRHIGFAGSTSGGGGSGVTNFYGRTGSVTLINTDNITVNDAAVTGDLTVTGDMTVNGDFTTLNTTLREVELLHVDANSSEPAGIITQRGSGDILNLYDNTTEVFSVADGGLVEVKARAADTKRVVLAGSPTNTTFQLAAYDGATGTGAGTTQAKFGLFYNTDENAVLKFERGSGAPDGALTINTNNTEQLRFLSNGDIRAGWGDKFIGIYHSADYYMGATFEAAGGTNRALFIDNRAGNGRGDIIFRTGVNQAPVERLTIKGTGNIGIGTNNPATQLEIHGDSGGTIRLAKGGANRTSVLAGDTLGKIEFRSYDTSLNHNSYNGTYVEIETVAVTTLGGPPGNNVRLDFKIADTDEPGSGKTITPVPALSILQGGKVGINSTDPTNMLDVVGTADVLGLYRNDYTGTGGAGLNLNFGGAKANGDLFNCAKITAIRSDNTGQAGQLRFSVLTSGSIEEKLRIATDGQITHTNFNGVGFIMSGSGDPTFQISDTDGTNQFAQLAHNGGDSYIVTRDNTSHGEFLVYSQNGSATLPRIKIGSDGTWYKYYDSSSTVQAAFGGTGQVNGITALPSMAGSPFVVGRDTGTTRSAHFAGHLQFDSGYGIQGTEFSVYGNTNGLYLNSNVSGDAIRFQTHDGSSVAERVRITSAGNVLIGNGNVTTQEGDGRLIVYANTRLHPAIKADCIDGGINRANGFTLLADNYAADESLSNYGLSYSGAGLVISRGVKVSNAADNTYLSSTDTAAQKPCAIKMDADSNFKFLNTNTSAQTTVDSAVTLTERFRINSVGEVWIKEGKLKLGTTTGTDNYIYSTNAAGIIYQADENGHKFQTYASGWKDRLLITDGGVIQTGSKTITGGNNLAIQNFAVKGVWQGAPSIGKSIELISGYDSAVKMAAIGYNLTDVNLTGSSYGGDLTFHTQPLYSSPTTPLPVRMRISSKGQVVIGTDPTVNGGTFTHIEAPTGFNSGETIVQIVGDSSTTGPRLNLQNRNTGANASSEILGSDSGGQSTSSIRFYHTDQSNNYGEIAFGTRNQSGVPPVDRVKIHHDGEVEFITAGYKFTENNFLSTSAATVNDATAQFTNAMTSIQGSYHSSNNTDGIMDFTDYKASDWNILDVYGRVNPNRGGSGAYSDPFFMTIYKGIGYTYPNVVTVIFAVMHTPAARTMYSSGTGSSGNDGITAVWYNGSSESREFTYSNSNNAANYLRIKVPTSSFNTNHGHGFTARIFKRF